MKPAILLVDDEQRVLESLALLLGREHKVHIATSGPKGLERLAADRSIEVVVSDMQMPGMNGAEFLAQVHRTSPSVVRMLLTGQADIRSAIAAINEGQIFRFLTKPVAPQDMRTALAAAVSQHRLVVAEKVLLEQTLRGSIRTLSDMLALANPVLFGRSMRIRRVVKALMQGLALGDDWQIDVAAMLLPLAQISLPVETAEKLSRAGELSAEERAMTARLPEVMDKLLAHIPRLETVRVMLAHSQEPYRQSECIEPLADAHRVVQGARLIKVAVAFDALLQSGLASADAVGVMRGQAERYDSVVVQLLGELYAEASDHRLVIESSLGALAPGMVITEDLVTRGGVLVVPKGFEVTSTFIERIRNYKANTFREPIRVMVGGTAPAMAAASP